MSRKSKSKAITKTISFGEEDQLLLEHFMKQTNSSAYVRGLIERDMREKNLPISKYQANNQNYAMNNTDGNSGSNNNSNSPVEDALKKRDDKEYDKLLPYGLGK